MKKRLRKYKVNTIKKRIISFSTATVMLMGDIPMPAISSFVGKVSSLFATTASADDAVTFYDKTEYTKTYLDTGYIHIESWADFVWYSQSYYNYSYGKYPDTTFEHEKDVLYINIKDSIANNYSLAGKDFVPIGNNAKPFEGRMIFTNTSADTFNVPETLFGTVSEKVSIKNVDETAVKQITLTRVGTGNGDALFAKKVVSDNNAETHSDWNIVLGQYNNSDAISYAGLIGEIDSSANVEVTFVNNALTGNSDVLATASSYSDGKPADAGVVCGKLGLNATLCVNYSGSNTGYSITSNNGNAGGIVGSMLSGSSLTLTGTNLQETAGVYATNGYAGGIVGSNNQGTVTISSAYTVNQFINGGNGAGGLFGYYASPTGTQELDVSNLTVSCTVNLAAANTGYCGGLIGVLENNSTGSDLTIKGTASTGTTVTSTHNSSTDEHGAVTGAEGKAYGGLIGSYEAEDKSYSLTIKDIKTAPTNTLASPNYGGCIGEVLDASYVKLDAFTLNSAAGTRSGNFGGLVAKNSKGYIYAKDIIIGTSTISSFTGGGLVGDLGDGVLGMTGTIDLSKAQPTASDANGILVGKRDNALIYSEGSWTYTPNSAEVDNVGSWGDVLIIDGRKLKKDTVSDSLNVFSESDHIIMIDSVNTSSIANAGDYAKVSLLYQIDVTKNDFIDDTPASLSSKSDSRLDLTFSDDIVLTGTGLRGITRDNGTDRVTYFGTISGGHSITLDIKNVGVSDRPVYRKKYIGMLGIADTVTINNTTFSGTILSKNVRDTSSDTTAYLGSAAAQVKTSFNASNCNTASGLSITMTGTNDTISGRLIGEAESAIGTIAISGSTFDGSITGNNKSTVGGTIGKIAGAASGATWSFNGITLRGHVNGIQHVGGLISDVDGSGNATIKLGNTSSVVADNSLLVEGNSSDSMGGLLGYSWSKADVEVTNVVVSGNPTVKQNSTGGAAGLVYSATGHWTVTKLYLGYTDAEDASHSIKMLTGTAGSVGMIVNKGKIGSAGIYLELPAGYDYKLAYYTAETGGSAFKSGGVFDEICAYSADSASKIMNNGQGIVSISTTGLTMEKSNTAAEGEAESLNYTDSLSYKNQTVQGKYKNGNTRYYYNLDTIDKDNTLSDNAKKLMRWGVRQYACSNIQKYFPDPFSSNTIPAGTYNMKGYSWYPVTPLNATTVNGTFTFYNEEFVECEKVKGKHANISNDSDKNIWSPLESDQHYMMQNGLFYNVNKNLTIGTISLAGTIGAINNSHGTGALVYGTVSGTAEANGTIVIDSTSGNISLAGVKVWNLDTYSSYAPLLINQASDYVTFNISNVSTTADYRASDTSTPNAATSLIGKAGTRTTATEDQPISQGISVNFTNIKLDGRSAENNSVYDKDRYNTTKSIFTNATLLEQLIGSAGTYNFDYDSDWGTGTSHNVTYGRELGYTTAGQYPNQELWYQNEKASDGKERYVRPDAAPADSGSKQYTGFTDSAPYAFLPYVHNVSTKANIDNKSEFKFQLMVNHQPSDRIYGCGTYNDPYIITSATDLINISKFINSNSNLTGQIYVDDTKDGWCNATDAEHLRTEHIEYTLGNTTCTTSATGKSDMTAEDMRKYLASAYYQIRLSGSTTLELSSDSQFLGLGTSDVPFCGVIDGGSSPVSITNKTQHPLINYSNGCVVRNLNITVNSTITLDDATAAYDYITGNKTHGAYGALIAVVEGGDNIIDNVQTVFGSSVIQVKGKKAQFQPVGGYVGVIVDGGVIFRNMSGNISGLAASNVTAVKGSENPQITNYNSTTHTANMTAPNNLLWLYVNPIIGRVINGFAVTQASSYAAGYASCTMNNGNKNYSITDIALSGGSLTISGSDITVPNGQAFFLMSVIVNSGMGSNERGYASTTVKRTANYDAIGSDATVSSGCNDYYNKAKKDTTSGTAYIISNFAAGGSTLGSGGPWDITLTANGSFILPDGYRGIGNFYQNNNNLLLNVSDFNGNGVTITQNTLFYTYDDGDKLFDDIYTPFVGIEGSTSYSSETDAGLGLFNRQTQGLANYYNLKLSGKVKSDVINHRTGTHVDYTTDNCNKKNVLSAGMLFGNFSGTSGKHVTDYSLVTTITNVALVDVEVSSAKMAGGLIGIVPMGNDSPNDYYANLNIIVNSSSYNSSGINVHAGLSAAGLIARYQQGICNINFNGNRFDIEEVISDTKSNTDSYYYGVGGIIGTLRADRGDPAGAVTIQNVTIGDSEATEAIEVKCSETGDCGINVGGLIGSLNRASATMINCHVYNVSVSSNGNGTHVGGAIGHARTNSLVTITNSSIETSDTIKASLTGKGYVGGFFGYAPNTKDGIENFNINRSGIKGYTITGNYVGAIVGEGSTKNSNTYKIVSNDFYVVDCNLEGTSYAGGLVGYLKTPLYGYNILMKNVSVNCDIATQNGYAIGKNDSVVKLVGFSRQEVLEEGENSEMIQAMTGGDGTPTNYGTGGYVIFADYNGKSSYNDDYTPGSNSKNDFSPMTSGTNVTPYAPYVTTSPVTNIANYSSVMQFVLSDGASPLATATFGRTTDAFANIYDDIYNTNEGYYSLPSSYLDTEAEYTAYTTKISSFKTEMGTTKKLASGIDFPVLVLDNINKAQMTEFINKYICLLTNTTTSSVSGGTYNFANNVAGVYNVVLKRVTFNSNGTEISAISDSDVCLKNANGQFYIEADDTDTKASNAQFTLIDVQFYDPSSVPYKNGSVDTSKLSQLKIAYHLYIPCYVRKLVEYDFDIHVESGTSYDINSYSSLVENSLVENVGTPITLEFSFTYNRTAEEWTAAANSGDSLLSNFPKDLLFDNATSGSKPNFPTTTKMVLIDTQNHSKAYYLDGLSDSSFVPDGNYRTLKFNQFSDLDLEPFSPVNLNDMLNVTVTTASDGTLVQSDSGATVKDTSSNITYRLATDAERDDNTIQKYTATVAFKDDADKLSEHYFLTIYTPYSTTDVVYHYVIQANKTLGTTPYPSRITAGSETHAVNLFIGYIYNNNVYIDSLKVNDIENEVAITKENNSIESTIHATIGLTSSGETNIRPTLSGDSPPDIYQSFLIKLNKDGDIGLAAVNSVTVEDYTIGGKPVTSRGLNPSWNSADYTDIEIPNYIQLRNGVPLATSLAEVAESETLTISAKATLVFDNDSGDITKQFFPNTSDKRTTFVAYSNIASSSSQTASSKVSAMKDVKVDGTKPQYYTLIEEKATLNYDALEVGSDGYLPQLGINANDPKDTKKFPWLIKTMGSYNVENCPSAWENANYLKIEIELKSKADEYSEALNIFNYLDESSFKIFNGEFSTAGSSTSKKLVYIIPKNSLTSYYKDKVYQIPIEFKVYSGSGSGNKFESEDRQYSNYGIFLKVSMLQASDSASAVTGTEPEYNNNYVKYTNARIYLEKVNPNKSAS